ncbi:MAG: DUF488 domain-containing protein [Candidatus Omnitrophica bacterium]|jgi:uncharacterized protein (DUF488 family)|nr:DUF488 domain-containing protein [Candidatus Omnitrophota bacterium]
MGNKLYSIGHSNRTLEEFISLLKVHTIKQIVDVRSMPKSRHNPQFNKNDLAKRLRNAGIGYRHMKQLGGLRRTKADSSNLGWKNLSFRGFADYMQTEKFAEALKKLKGIASKKKTAIMCAEALPWRCHRSLISDVFTKDHWQVFGIISLKTAKPHNLTSFLRVRKGKILYPRLRPN